MAADTSDSMKTALFHYPILNVGGAEKSTLRMIKALADRGWSVTLVLTTGGGALEPEIDPRVRVVRLRPRACGHRFTMARGLAARVRALPDLFCYAVMRMIGALRMLPFLWHRYDAAVVGIHSTSSWFIRMIVRTKKRIHWIRNDLHGVDPDLVMSDALAQSDSKIDLYVCVAQSAYASLTERLPQVAEKSVVLYNILDPDTMLARMLDPTDGLPLPTNDEIRILTVGRLLNRDKAIYRLARICHTLKSEGYAFRWFLVGDGPDRDTLESLIAYYEIGDILILLGQKSNPFPYYRDADLVAMVSNHEGLSGMINEAKVCGRSVLATRVSGVDEQLTDGVNGWIVENNELAITAALRDLLANPKKIRATTNMIYPREILDDSYKIDILESVILGQGSVLGN